MLPVIISTRSHHHSYGSPLGFSRGRSDIYILTYTFHDLAARNEIINQVIQQGLGDRSLSSSAMGFLHQNQRKQDEYERFVNEEHVMQAPAGL